MTRPVRLLERLERATPLLVVATLLFQASCGGSGTKTPDAAGSDAAPDVAAMDVAQDRRLMTSSVRFLKWLERVAPLIVVAICLLGAGCGSSGTKTPDAAGVDGAPDATGVDMAPDVAATDMGSSPDGGATDGARDSTAGDVAGPPDGGGADGGDGGADPCRPPCRARIYGGCPPEGTCTYATAVTCYSNGVIVVDSVAGGTTRQTLSKNGAVCATLDAAYVWRDPNGAPLGTVTLKSDGSATLTCTGEAPVTVPASCGIPCNAGTCSP